MSKLNELLETLRRNTGEYPKQDFPTDTIQRIAYIRSLTSYDTLFAKSLADMLLMNPLTDEVLVEAIGRYKILHYFLQRLDGMDLESVESIRFEIQKRSGIYTELKKVLRANYEIELKDLKILMSALMRVVIEFEKKEIPISFIEIGQIVLGSVGSSLTESDRGLLNFLFLGVNNGS